MVATNVALVVSNNMHDFYHAPTKFIKLIFFTHLFTFSIWNKVWKPW